MKVRVDTRYNKHIGLRSVAGTGDYATLVPVTGSGVRMFIIFWGTTLLNWGNTLLPCNV